MDEILATKPKQQLAKAPIEIQNYVFLLEKKLKGCLAMSSLNKEIQKKLFAAQQELRSLQIKQKENCPEDDQLTDEINKLKVDKTILEIENKQLKQELCMQQNQLQQLQFHQSGAQRMTTAATVKKTQRKEQTQTGCVAAEDDPNSNSVLIKGLAEHQLNMIPKLSVIALARSMNLKVLDTDIIKVTQMERKYYERHHLKPNKIILIVQLKTPEVKVAFLKSKEKLKDSDEFAEVEVIDYVSDDVYNLYQYAKILKDCGYAQIFWRNNCVYAKKTRSTYCEPVPIRTKHDVDILKNPKK